MPNIASLLKEEITRIAKKEIRAQTKVLKSNDAGLKKELIALKRRVSQLERQLNKLENARAKSRPAAKPEEANAKVRFTAKGLKSLRKRLGLSAAQFAKLAGISAISVYNFENGKVEKPRPSLLAKMAALRSIGKKEAKARLEAIDGPKAPKPKKEKKKAASPASRRKAVSKPSTDKPAPAKASDNKQPKSAEEIVAATESKS